MNHIEEKLKKFAKGEKKVKKEGGNAIIYNRVSSKEQMQGFSLEAQEEACKNTAKRKGFEVLEFFGGTYESAKSDVERREFKRALDYVKTHKGRIDAVIVYSTSRFSRTGSTAIIEELEKLNVRVISAITDYDTREISGKLVQRMELTNAMIDNAMKSKATIDSGRRALLNGRIIFPMPLGYHKEMKAKTQKISITKEGYLIRKAFEMKAAENLTTEEVRVKLKAMGLDLNKQRWSEIFKRPIYCGTIVHPYLEGEIMQGNFEAITTPEIFLKVNNLLEASHASGYEQTKENEYAPLLKTIKCPVCGGNLSASLSTKMKKKFNKEIPYYTCWRKGCRVNNAAKEVHEAFESVLGSLSLPAEFTGLIKAQLVKTFNALNQENKNTAIQIKTTLSKKEAEIEIVEMNFAMATDPRKTQIYEKALDKLNAEKAEIEAELERFTIGSLNLERYIEQGLSLSVNLMNLWELANLGDKKRLQNLLFSEGIVFDKENKVIEPRSTNRFFVQTTCKSINNEQKKNGQKGDFTSLSALAPCLGLEPRTP